MVVLSTGRIIAALTAGFVFAAACANQKPQTEQPKPTAEQIASQTAPQTTTQTAAPQYRMFGDSTQATPEAKASKPLTLVEARQSTNHKKLVRVEARITDVCKKKGCWMVMTDGTQSMRITFKDYGFFVPAEILGRTVIAHGIVKEDILSEKDARHYAEDAGKSADEIKKIKGDQKQISMVASLVMMPVQ